MEMLISKVKSRPEVKTLLKDIHLGAFFDDLGIGTNSVHDHLVVLEALLDECKKHNLRIKLSKCEFLSQLMGYLGFHLNHGTWQSSPKKVEAIMRAKVSNLKELQSFLGAMNFFRRHIPKFSDSSHILTDLLKKGTPWTWTDLHQQKLDELKSKLSQLTQLGTPKCQGEIVLLTDSSDHQGGASIYQWQPVSTKILIRLGKSTVSDFATQGVSQDGKLIHNYPEQYTLVPLGPLFLEVE